jgi:hypothetical protein
VPADIEHVVGRLDANRHRAESEDDHRPRRTSRLAQLAVRAPLGDLLAARP